MGSTLPKMKLQIAEATGIEFYTYTSDWIGAVPYVFDTMNFCISFVDTWTALSMLQEWKCSKNDIEYFVPGEHLYKLSGGLPQFIWGVFSALPKKLSLDKIVVTPNFSIFRNPDLWKANVDSYYIKESIFEIVAFDSSYFLLQTEDKQVFESFRKSFKNARVV
jgi:hypothetical protein